MAKCELAWLHCFKLFNCCCVYNVLNACTFVWQSADMTSADMTSLFDDDYYYSVTVTPKVMSHVKMPEPKSSVPPRLASITRVAMQNKEYLGNDRRYYLFDSKLYVRVSSSSTVVRLSIDFLQFSLVV